MNVVGLTSTTNPYIQARWSAFSVENPGYNVFLIEFGKVSKVYAWKPVEVDVPYKRIVLSDKPSQYQSLTQLFLLVKYLYKALSKSKPDVLVLNGYQQPATLATLIWSKLHHKPAILLSESKEDDAPRKWAFEAIKRIVVGRYRSALVGGKKHENYLAKLGMDRSAIFLGYDVIGNDAYNPANLSRLPQPSEAKRPYFLAVDRFVTQKNIPTILKAYADYRKHMSEASIADATISNSVHNEKSPSAWDLIICGDGELRPQIEAQMDMLDLKRFVHLTGFLQPDELLPYFAHASCFVHASTQEQWGLVVNEAMASGLPVIVSRCCGCFDELVLEGVNGFGFDANNQTELAELMRKMSRPEIDLAQMRQAALKQIDQFGPSFFAQGMRKAVQHAVLKHAKQSCMR